MGALQACYPMPVLRPIIFARPNISKRASRPIIRLAAACTDYSSPAVAAEPAARALGATSRLGDSLLGRRRLGTRLEQSLDLHGGHSDTRKE
jgi:hypothetical protein